MNFEFGEIINPYLEKADFDQAIQLAEAKLAAISATPFHAVIGKSFFAQAPSLCSWINNFYKASTEAFPVCALYFELTEFDINTDEWSIDGLAYPEDGGLEDTEWLAESSEVAVSESAFVLEGWESLQEAFEDDKIDSDDEQNARDWCEQLIIARYMQLVRAAHQHAKEQAFAWSSIPVYCTEHGYDFIVRSSNKG
ncbi:hypothetical protein [Hymenobacter sp. HDW8]|uniref:hypothetical protein n=1 Tax=Hymenobacter sp. HDW8 TaxID=2714932 RepID=UPI00140D73D2|nr:hypothetical protein [Hymenobacter sp. HDW8]QIL77589.1 hypothetical protein G7064_18380 [Hymenobacter sp. HDW8]